MATRNVDDVRSRISTALVGDASASPSSQAPALTDASHYKALLDESNPSESIGAKALPSFWRGGVVAQVGTGAPAQQQETARHIQNLASSYLYVEEDAHVRAGAAEALGEIGPKAFAAVPYLINALKDSDADVRCRTADALGEIGRAAAAGVAALIAGLKDQNWDVRVCAASALGKIGPLAVPALIAALKDQDAHVRAGAAWALGEIGPKAFAAVPLLIKLLKDPDEDVRGEAADALGKIDPIKFPPPQRPRTQRPRMIDPFY